MQKHFITFLSPGTFVAETREKEIDSWDVDKAVTMSKKIVERYNARPYGFYFTTRARSDNDLDSKEVKRSGTYYLGGKILTLAQIKARKNPKDSILISNMQSNKWDRVVENGNSWITVQPLESGDTVLDVSLR